MLQQIKTFRPKFPAHPEGRGRMDYTFRSTEVLDADTLFSATVARTADGVGRIVGPDGKELPNGPMVALDFTSGLIRRSFTVDAGQYRELTGMSVPEDWRSAKD